MISPSRNILPQMQALEACIHDLENALFPPAATRTSPALRGAIHTFRNDLGRLAKGWAVTARPTLETLPSLVDLLIDSCHLLIHALLTRTRAGLMAVRGDRERIEERYRDLVAWSAAAMEQPGMASTELLDATRLAILTCIEACDAVVEERFSAAAQTA